jgi:hypothetical protein
MEPNSYGEGCCSAKVATAECYSNRKSFRKVVDGNG